MSTFGRGIRLEFEQLSLGSSVTTDQLLIDVPTTANYFVWINHLYAVVIATNQIGGNFFGVDKNKSTNTATIYHTFSNGNLANEKDFFLADNTAESQERIVYPGQQVRVIASNTASSNAFLYYTKVYFGGQANV
jgi:hypothetical protein